MYTWLMDFNLRGTAEEIERYMISMIRDWPPRYQKVDGVLGITFLAAAWGLAGSYTFRMVLDMKSLETLRAVDEMYKADAAARRALNEFRTNRKDLSCRLLRQEGGERSFCEAVNKAAQPTFVYSFAAPAQMGADELRRTVRARGEMATYATVVEANGKSGFEAWHAIPDLSGVDEIGGAVARIGASSSQLHSAFRIVDGGLVAAA